MIELEKMLKDLYLLSGLNMSIFDLNQNLLASYPHKKSKFCNEIGKNKKSYQHCLDCDYKAMEHVKESGELYIYKCHFGLNEAIMPLYSYGVLTGYLMMGQAVIGTYRNYSEIIEKSKEYFALAAVGSSEPSPVRYYNDQPSDYIYYQGLAYAELGDAEKAENSFNHLVLNGEKHKNDKIEYDFFAVSMPELEVYQDDIQKRSDDYCKYLTYLGKKGLEEIGR